MRNKVACVGRKVACGGRLYVGRLREKREGAHCCSSLLISSSVFVNLSRQSLMSCCASIIETMDSRFFMASSYFIFLCFYFGVL